MRIGELARRAACDVETVRFYEREQLLDAPAREDNGYRPKGMNLFVADMRRVYPGVNVIRQQIGGERKRIFAGLELAEMLDFGSKEETDGI